MRGTRVDVLVIAPPGEQGELRHVRRRPRPLRRRRRRCRPASVHGFTLDVLRRPRRGADEGERLGHTATAMRGLAEFPNDFVDGVLGHLAVGRELAAGDAQGACASAHERQCRAHGRADRLCRGIVRSGRPGDGAHRARSGPGAGGAVAIAPGRAPLAGALSNISSERRWHCRP